MTRRQAATLTEALRLKPPALVSLVGGGGKTTAMYRLLRELTGAGVDAVAATTTRIAPPNPGDGAELVCGSSWEEMRSALRHRPRGRAPVLGVRALASGKVEGISPVWCGRLLREGLASALIVEADGAARLPLKAPEAWEPVVPGETTHFVAVVGLSCAGQPLAKEFVFRPERIASAAGAVPGEPLTPDTVARVLASPEGLLKALPKAARAVAILNQADLPGALDFGRAVIELLLASTAPYEFVVLGALAREGTPLEVWAR